MCNCFTEGLDPHLNDPTLHLNEGLDVKVNVKSKLTVYFLNTRLIVNEKKLL